MHLHCGFSVARLLKGLSNTLCSIHMEGRQDLSFWETIRLKSLPTFECSALHKQVNMITAVWVGFFFEGAKNTPQKLTCALKKGSIQKKKACRLQLLFCQGTRVSFLGSNPYPFLNQGFFQIALCFPVIRIGSKQPLDEGRKPLQRKLRKWIKWLMRNWWSDPIFFLKYRV